MGCSDPKHKQASPFCPWCRDKRQAIRLADLRGENELLLSALFTLAQDEVETICKDLEDIGDQDGADALRVLWAERNPDANST